MVAPPEKNAAPIHDITNVIFPVLPKTTSKNGKTAGKLVALVITTVIVFIFSFASATSWVVFAQHALPAINSATPKEMFNVKAYGIFAGVLTLVTLVLAIGFAFGTKNIKAKVPLDFNALLKNVQTDLDSGEERKHKIYVQQHVPFEL
jgi:hypothetical protein